LAVPANRTLTNKSREADTQVQRHDDAEEPAYGPISPSVLQRGDVTIFGRTDGRECHDRTAGVQGNQAKAGTAIKEEDFLPYLRNFSGPPCSQRHPYPGKRNGYTWNRQSLHKEVAAAVRKGWTTTTNGERAPFDRCHIASLPSV